jgi:hypothetical protein
MFPFGGAAMSAFADSFSRSLSRCFCGGIAVLAFAEPVSGAAMSKEKVLYDFKGGADGSDPSSGLTPDGADNLYGTTMTGGGGGGRTCNSDGCGTVFKLSRDGTEAVL